MHVCHSLLFRLPKFSRPRRDGRNVVIPEPAPYSTADADYSPARGRDTLPRTMEIAVPCYFCHLPVRLRRGRTGNGATPEPVYCCYGCRFASQITQARGERGHANWLLTRLGVSAFLSMGVMVFSLAMYSRDVYDLDPTQASHLAESLTGLFRYISLALATPVFLLLGLPILSSAVRQLRTGVASTDALVVLGVAAAFVYSYISTLTDHGAVYYETACMVLVLVTLGRYLEATGKLKASDTVEALDKLVPVEISVRRGDKTVTVPSTEIQLGDLALVAPGERIPVDGRIEAGRAGVDEQLLTGESTPVAKSPGDEVHAGTISLDGSLTVSVTAVGSDSALGRLTALLEEAKRSKGRYERLADRVVGVFVPFVVVLAIAAGVLGYRRGSVDDAIMSSLAVLLIACPCALGIATPMAIWVGMGRAAARGVLFRNGEAIEALAGVRTIALDKTGTLTSGEPSVDSFDSASSDETTIRRYLIAAAGLAAASNHTLAGSVARYVEQLGHMPVPLVEMRVVPGRGIVGDYNGTTIRLGSQAMMSDAGLSLDDGLDQVIRRQVKCGRSIACLGYGETVVGVFAFTETLRFEAPDALGALGRLGCELKILTGDHAAVGVAIAKELGIETVAELTPADKIRELESMARARGAVAMVGDGLNDAPALAAADVGIAMGCGADLTRESAAVCLLGNDLRAIPFSIRLARRTVHTIKVNLFWAFSYNVIGISLAMTGKLNPMLAAAAMVASSLFVVTNSLRSGAPETVRDRTWHENSTPDQSGNNCTI